MVKCTKLFTVTVWTDPLLETTSSSLVIMVSKRESWGEKSATSTGNFVP